ncbi:E3 ubiquitin-protein ligase parkin isoform X1 [Ischnura elegans]|uniref:E3 ubiquitin-protein ligase parkin isoform X1 n=2 Tax=Ischnura elegans TaxID=197161 RepID=UPI001ED87500|nr:E3 ubiquitin-protein ligase parkin isoform X1 [Ischnura elegans]
MSFILNFFKYLFQRMLQVLKLGGTSSSNSLSIYVKTNTGNTFSVDLDPKWEVKNVKEVVAAQLGLAPDEIKIIFAGKELHDSIVIEECDLGQQSFLHAVKKKPTKKKSDHRVSIVEEEESVSTESFKPLCETLMDLQLDDKERGDIHSKEDRDRNRAHFFVYCGVCKGVRRGKLRVRCSACKEGAFTVERDPCCWEDVLDRKDVASKQSSVWKPIGGQCETSDCPGGGCAQFYFKCAEHTPEVPKDSLVASQPTEEAVALYLIKTNARDVPCLACTEISDPVLVFPCEQGHVTCLDCFRAYCISRLKERRFEFHPLHGCYTLPCPAGCPDSLLTEAHHFRLLTEAEYEQYQRFGAEEYVLQAGGVLCPQPGCGMGIIADPECRRIQCIGGCGFVFCRNCLQGYHIGECTEGPGAEGSNIAFEYNIDPERAAQARWDEASKVAIKVTTKPCPKCRTPTERDGGCMHMVCTRSQCGFHWCWVCQTEWSRECMGNHWFG